MMFVEHDAVETQLFGIDALVEILMVELVPLSRIKAGIAHIGEAEVAVLVGNDVVLAHVKVRALGESHDMHLESSFGLPQAKNCCTRWLNSGCFSISGRWPQRSSAINSEPAID